MTPTENVAEGTWWITNVTASGAKIYYYNNIYTSSSFHWIAVGN